MQLSDEMRASIKRMLTAPPNKYRISQTQRYRRIIASEGRGGRERTRDGMSYHSDALGVNPDQIPEATEALRRAGVMADFDPDGSLIVTSSKQFREAAKACGMFTGRDGYGTMNSDCQFEDTGRALKDKRDRFRREIDRYAEGRSCDPAVSALFEGI